jgi:hypothetical protein
MASGFRLRGVATPDDFPFAQVTDYNESIGADAATKFWLMPTAERVTITSGWVTAGVGRGPAVSYVGGPSPRGPEFQEELAAINDLPSLHFAVASERKYIDVAGVFPTSDFSILAVLNLDTSAETTRRILKTSAGGNPSYTLDILGGASARIDSRFLDADGSEARALTLTGSIALTGPLVVLACWDEAAKTMHVSKDFGHSWSSDTEAAFDALSGAAMDVRIGASNDASQGLGGSISGLWIGNVALKNDATRLQLHREFVRDVFALDYT